MTPTHVHDPALHLDQSVVHSDEDAQTLQVTSRRSLAADVVELALNDPGGNPLPEWSAGAHIDLILSGAEGEELVRQYSLSGSPHDRHSYRVAILREPNSRGGSRAVHDTIHVGTVVATRGPRNNFEFALAPRYLFIAGGIGITPILPMLAQADTAGADWRLLYGGRARASMAYLDELAAYGEQVIVHPQEEHGLIPLDTVLCEPVPNTLVYACGPTALLDAVTDRMISWPPRSLHLERFVPIERVAREPDRATTVTLARSGLTLQIPAGVSILDAVEAAGVNVLASCREGTCGTCETTILSGLADHRDSVLSPEEQDEQDAMMICVSRSRTDELTLNL
jgi:ferredoxin-NADP reductase